MFHEWPLYVMAACAVVATVIYAITALAARR
jgi:hypothetical protein